MKQCTKCKASKELDKFYKKRSTKIGLTSKCIKCTNEQTGAWHKKNRDRKIAAGNKYRFANPEKIKLNGRNWAKNNKGKRNAQTMRRIAAKKQATPKWLSPEDHEKINQFYILASEITKESGIPHEVDHIVPLQGKEVRGLHVPWNLQILPRSQNRSKMNKIVGQS